MRTHADRFVDLSAVRAHLEPHQRTIPRRHLMSRDRDASRKVFGHPENERLHELRHAVVIDLFDHRTVGRPELIAR